VVAWPRAAHPAAALLRQGGLEQLVAPDAAGFVQTAARLCHDARWRRDLTARLAAKAPQQLLRYDSFTVSEAFGALVESACDGIRQSRRAFRTVSAAMEPEVSTPPAALREEAEMFIEMGSLADAEARLRRLLLTGHEAVATRRRLADVLLRAGRPAEAADLLLSVVPLVPDDASAWLEIGLAARQAGRVQLALKAMQTSVQLEPKRVQSWRTLAELARENRNSDLLEQINVVLGELDAAAAEPALVASR
jgi:tetratricopeptide (TPR) repeat protein